GVALLAAGFLLVSQIDTLLKPVVIGARLLMHPMAVFFALLGGVLSRGPIGLMAGPMLLALLLMLHDVVREMMGGKQPAAEAHS
ncbi:MAG TPA: AI-2E family transporter, partial [Fimbriimonadaceae bacterium]|nr:AI-2E family transporter [Fimbriimonadaceae bacterium]